MNKGSP